MQRAGFRFAVTLALVMAAATLIVAWIYDLPVRDPDSVAGPTYLRLPAILLLAFVIDVLPRALWRARNPLKVAGPFAAVVRERWDPEHIRFALLGLGAWYVTYASFRNLKSFVPFVNTNLYDDALDRIDRVLFLGHDPATLLHDLLGTGWAAHFLSFVYVAWIALVPFSIAVALVWTRDRSAGAWFVTAIAVDWALGVAVYFALPTLGPIYARPELFATLPPTDVTTLQATLLTERIEVLTNPFTTTAVQTIAAFASLHVGISVTMAVMGELLRWPRAVRIFLWVFLGLTVLSTVYFGWHYALDAVGGAVLGVTGVVIAAWGTRHTLRRRPAPQPETAAASRAA